jgi:FkbM family methyltransferase
MRRGVPPFAKLLRRAVIRSVGGRRRVVRVLSGIARGRRLDVDLGSQKAYWTGRYERQLQRFLRETLRPGDVFYDVGAHQGFFSVCAARLGARVYAFEPVEGNLRQLHRNIELNDADVEIVAVAVSDAGGRVGLARGASSAQWRTEPGDAVAAVTLDDFARDHPAPRVVKIDVEGAELHVLRGAVRVLREHRPIVVCELHGREIREQVRGLLEGYEFRTLESERRLVAVPVRRQGG